MAGKLFVIPTPIGNLEDITLRALRILKEVNFILAEDTRTTKFLLSHYQIQKPLFSFHKFNEHQKVLQLVSQISLGESVGLVSDAGTPSISDPGFLLVRSCVENQIEVECLPGATAFVPALVVSGFPSDKFCFEGFLPQKKGRNKRLSELSQETRTMIFYESPYRILKTLQQFAEFFGEERKVSVSKEISKIYERTFRDTLKNLILQLPNENLKGEFVVVVEGKK